MFRKERGKSTKIRIWSLMICWNMIVCNQGRSHSTTRRPRSWRTCGGGVTYFAGVQTPHFSKPFSMASSIGIANVVEFWIVRQFSRWYLEPVGVT